jgi:transposase-like protein
LSEKWEKRHPSIIRFRTDSWAEFAPSLQFDHAIRQAIYTTRFFQAYPHLVVRSARDVVDMPSPTTSLALKYEGAI